MNPSKDYRHDLDYLLQQDLIANFIPSIGQKPWQVVYAIDDRGPDRSAIFCALLERKAVKGALEKDGWDLAIGDGLPGFSQSWQEGKTTTTYHRFGTEGLRPLVISRNFHGAFPCYLELCEEFRLFHNLAEDHQRGLLLDFDESGYEVEVARITERKVEVNWRYLLQFLAATQLYLAIYFDSIRYSMIPLEKVPKEKQQLEYREKKMRYSVNVRECDFQRDYRTLSRLLGKVIVAPLPIKKCGKWPFEERGTDPEVSFIIGVTPDGRFQEFTSNPEKLSNYFGANQGAPHYLTPVYFRKEVLQKYYAEPDRYSVEDGYLRCLGLWGMQIDNDHPTHVIAFLGDLGRDLPYRERLHWKQYNVPPPANAGISATCFRRSFLAQFADPESVDLVFTQKYQELNKTWRERMGWPLFLEPKPGDEHVLAVHIPVTGSQRELDEQILALTKLLVDSLNEQGLERELTEKRKEERGIQKFERFLKNKGCKHGEEIIVFLRDLQGLRSAGVAHRKGSEYERRLERLGILGKDNRDVMKILLMRAVNALHLLLLDCVQGME
ncbi:MAG: hypothetical protein QN157_06425 [Armatimonadota bacterium]|nr:hypothetical protein [Armatimonadota bacterium]